MITTLLSRSLLTADYADLADYYLMVICLSTSPIIRDRSVIISIVGIPACDIYATRVSHLLGKYATRVSHLLGKYATRVSHLLGKYATRVSRLLGKYATGVSHLL
ncbi:MAG: hypothetical protein P9X24_07880 [Candidatus Hatepunaea meridiana]|nr:hypothetical protein [Candidatus Hatepunaea meridiana]